MRARRSTALATVLLALAGCSDNASAPGARTDIAESAATTARRPVAAKGKEVVFEATGTSGRASVSYVGAGQPMQEERVTLPWTKTIPAGTVDYLAVIVSGPANSEVSCRATVNGKEVGKDTSKDLPVAKCSVTFTSRQAPLNPAPTSSPVSAKMSRAFDR